MRAATILVVATAAALAGCGTARTVQVKVPVPVECRVQMPARPAMPLDALQAPYRVDAWTAHAIAEIGVREGYERELVAALGQCVATVDRLTETMPPGSGAKPTITP